MDSHYRQSIILALQTVRKHLEEEGYAEKNVQVRMRGAHLLAMALLGHSWPQKSKSIPEAWYK